MKQVRKESKKMILNLEDIWKHKDKAIAALASATTPVQSKPAIAQAVAPVKAPEVLPKDETMLLKEAFQNALDIPFQFGKDKWVKFEGGQLLIGERKFALKLSDGGVFSPEVSSIQLVG